MFNISLLRSAAVIIICVLANKLSNKIGMPVLIAFIALGMVFGSDGILKIPFENYSFAEQICSVALVFIMFYGGFGTKLSEAKPVAVKALLLSSVGVIFTAALTTVFCFFVLKIKNMQRNDFPLHVFLYLFLSVSQFFPIVIRVNTPLQASLVFTIAF